MIEPNYQFENSYGFENKNFKSDLTDGFFEMEDINTFNKQYNPLKEFENLSSISLFKEPDIEKNVIKNVDETERPITPINDSITFSPTSFELLSEFIRRRIQPRISWKHLKEVEQANMASIILAEARSRFRTFCEIADDPFLSKKLNKELKRRITVQIVSICEQLFLYHSNHIKVLNKKGVYSNSANLTRTYMQLTIDADKFLNIFVIRRRILEGLKQELIDGYRPGTICKDERFLKKLDPVVATLPTIPNHLSFDSLIRTNSLSSDSNIKTFTLMKQIQDLDNQIPLLPFDRYEIFKEITERKQIIEKDKSEPDISSSDSDVTESISLQSQEQMLQRRLTLSKCPSHPNLKTLKLLDELSKERRGITYLLMSSSSSTSSSSGSEGLSKPYLCKSIDTALNKIGWDQKINNKKSVDYNSDLREDLNRVTKQLAIRKRDPEDEDGTIPSLIQTITRIQKRDRLTRDGNKLDVGIDERLKQIKENENWQIRKTKHPQPPILQIKMPPKSNPVDGSELITRTCDVTIPNNVQLPDSELARCGPISNVLAGHVPADVTDEMDETVRGGRDIVEVYDQLWDTLSFLHFNHDCDPLIIVPPNKVDLDLILASSTLSKPPSQQIINTALTKKSLEMRQIARKRENEDFDDLGDVSQFSSWLERWKSTITADDYIKYLSTQETDYLNAIFHFYESPEQSVSSASSEEEIDSIKLFQNKLSAMLGAKTAQWNGMWNAQSVILGGLGGLPDPNKWEDFNNEDLTTEQPNSSDIKEDSSSILVKSDAVIINSDSYEELPEAEPSVSEIGKILRKSFVEKERPSNNTADYNNSFSTMSSLEDTMFEDGSNHHSFDEDQKRRKSFVENPVEFDVYGIRDRTSSPSSMQSKTLQKKFESSKTKEFDLETVLKKQSSVETPKDDEDIKLMIPKIKPNIHISALGEKIRGPDVKDKIRRTNWINEPDDDEKVIKKDEEVDERRDSMEDEIEMMIKDQIEDLKKINAVEKKEAENEASDLTIHKIKDVLKDTVKNENIMLLPFKSKSIKGATIRKKTRFQDFNKTNFSDIDLSALIDEEDQEEDQEENQEKDEEKDHEEIKKDERKKTKKSQEKGGEVEFKDYLRDEHKDEKVRDRDQEDQDQEGQDQEDQDQKDQDQKDRGAIKRESVNWYSSDIYPNNYRTKRIRLLSNFFQDFMTNQRKNDLKFQEDKTLMKLQTRVEGVWSSLKMQDKDMMDMAAKLCRNPFNQFIEKDVEIWEEISSLIIRRESYLSELEAFERFASDPRRLFNKVGSGSVGRLEEAKRRSKLYKSLEHLEKKIKPKLEEICKKFNFVVKYNGRKYAEKMASDKVEMLYWLQQERRCEVVGGERGKNFYRDLLDVNRTAFDEVIYLNKSQFRPLSTIPSIPTIEKRNDVL